MKKHIIMLAAFCGFAITAQAQSSYFRVGTGYAFNGAPVSGTTTEDRTFKEKGLSFGKGLNNQLAFGHMFGEHFGAEIAIGYLKGIKQEYKGSYSSSGSTSSSTDNIWGNMISVNPSFIVKGGGQSVIPYARMGMVFGRAKATTTNSSRNNFNGISSSEEEREYTGGIAMGLNGALGANFKVTEKLGIYAEASMLQMSWAPTKGELTKSIKNGVNVLSSTDLADREAEFVDEIAVNTTQNPNQVAKVLKQKFPFSNAGINLGIEINF